MNERDDLKLPILSALRRLVKFALQPDAPERIEVCKILKVTLKLTSRKESDK